MSRKDQAIEMNIGPNIVALRKRYNLSQAQLAQMIGKSVSTISGYENNTILPPIKILFKLEALFETTVGDLMNFKSNLANGMTVAMLIEQYRRLTGEEDD